MRSRDVETCWTLIRGAAAGQEREREEFATRYLPTVRAYLSARWRGTSLLADVEDVVQEVFLACYRDGGVLERADPERGASFRALLYRVSQNIALHTERTRYRRRAKLAEGPFEPDWAPADEATLSKVFDREYARTIMRDARTLMTRKASASSQEAHRRVELLRLRFEEGLPIREIARRWSEEPARLHREYETARREFKRALAEAITTSERCSPERLERECSRLLQLLRS